MLLSILSMITYPLTEAKHHWITREIATSSVPSGGM